MTTTGAGPTGQQPLKVALLGHGAIGSVLADRLTAGAVDGARLIGIIARPDVAGSGTPCPGSTRPESTLPGTPRPGATEPGPPHPDTSPEPETTQFGETPRGTPTATAPGGVPVLDLAEGIAAADVVVECASVAAARELGPEVIAAGRTLLVASIGALADAATAAALTAGPGRLVLTTGAVGGLDALAAHRQAGGLRDVLIISTKRASTLLQPWMDDAERTALERATTPVTVFEGTAVDVIDRFPRSANVAVAVGLAVGDPRAVTVRMVADPAATRTVHRISGASDAGAFRAAVENDPSPRNPASSALVPYAMLSALAALARPSGRFA
ncbi:hypothetical protein BKD30_14470 [Tersicoccus phoenicis]|uniref:L-aspartate dehydrogenase n=1 Tax=Tersicoccus phoenicis TaxID=554083 RepID=A0A1R1L6A1_9MICC|nr:aspartate dehydrogenase domain-containing protein [Tersicoccus phoenicis]OMH23071.1 hypothetical protein BKD30_14470 [Tersicoccus phoenicis]